MSTFLAVFLCFVHEVDIKCHCESSTYSLLIGLLCIFIEFWKCTDKVRSSVNIIIVIFKLNWLSQKLSVGMCVCVLTRVAQKS